jgi:hypothetical protein
MVIETDFEESELPPLRSVLLSEEEASEDDLEFPLGSSSLASSDELQSLSRRIFLSIR